MTELRITGGKGKSALRYIEINHLSHNEDWVKDFHVCIGFEREAQAVAETLSYLLKSKATQYPIRISLEVADRDCESHYIPIKFEINGFDVSISYEEHSMYARRNDILKGVQEYLEARYYAMGI